MFRSVALLAVSFAFVGFAHAATVFSDDFSDAKLYSAWDVQRGHAKMDGGWVELQGSTSDTRDSVIQTLVGSDWSNYRLSTRFDALGGGDDWYMSMIYFRVQEHDDWGTGTYYRLDIMTPAWTRNLGGDGRENSLLFYKVVDSALSESKLVSLPAGILNDQLNTVDILAVGGRFDITLNGTAAARFFDSTPIQTGGIALGSIWESTTRYDYVNVTSVVPEPEIYAMLLAGLGLFGFMVFRRKESAA